MKNGFIYIASLLLLIISIGASVKEDPLTALLAKLKQIAGTQVQEIVHLHMDKPYYAAGDHIWFKAYVLDEPSLNPSEISAVLYVELIRHQKAIKTLKLPLENGMGWGDFLLPDTLAEGNYRIRAYTQWMRNAGEQYFFDKTIAIGNGLAAKLNEIPPVKKDPSDNYQIAFFPEGGRIVQGIPCKIAVKVTQANGLGGAVEGRLDNKSLGEITFNTNHQGIGAFFIIANDTATRVAKITFKNGTEKEYSLPAIQKSGYTLAVLERDEKNKTAQISMSPDLLNKGTLALVGQRNGNIYFVQKVPTDKQVTRMAIPTETLPPGILQLSLFSPDNRPVCEQFTLINDADKQLDIQMEGIKPVYTQRAAVQFTISARQKGLPVSGNFSLSVTNTRIVKHDPDKETNILSSFLLKGESPEYIETPNKYLNRTSKDSSEVSLLLMTHHWRHLPWEMLTDKKPVSDQFPTENGISISGTLTNRGKPVANGKVTLMKSAGGLEVVSSLSDEQGHFSFDGLSLQDSTKLLIQARTAGDKKNVKILIDQLPPQLIHINKNWPDEQTDIHHKLNDYIRHSNNFFKEQRDKGLLGTAIELKAVEIKAEPIRESNTARHGHPEKTLTSKDLDSVTFLSSVLMGNVRGNYTKYNVILDGIPVSDRSLFFISMDPAEIDLIEIYSNTILFTSKPPSAYRRIGYAPGVTTLTPNGFSHSNRFYSPDYDTKKDDRPDLRSTVYWNPDLKTDENGNITIKYFNPDVPGIYRIVIEGIGGNSGIGRKEIYYEVK